MKKIVLKKKISIVQYTMKAQEQIFINKLESRQNLNKIITLAQNRFFDFFIEFLLIFGLEKIFFR